jgi:hypothetical protein
MGSNRFYFNSDYTVGWMIQASITKRENKFLSSSKGPDWLWGLPSPLFGGYRGYFLWIKRPGPRLRLGRAVPLLPHTHFHEVASSDFVFSRPKHN